MPWSLKAGPKSLAKSAKGLMRVSESDTWLVKIDVYISGLNIFLMVYIYY